MEKDLRGWSRKVQVVGVGPAGTTDAGDKNITFLAETLPKLRFFGTSYSFHPIHF
jgi:hypothetical protein